MGRNLFVPPDDSHSSGADPVLLAGAVTAMSWRERLGCAIVGQPIKRNKPAAAIAVVLSMVLAWASAAEAGGRKLDLAYIAVLGVIVASLYFGVVGGLIAGGATMALLSPLGPLHPPLSTTSWMTQGVLALFIGAGAGARTYLIDRRDAETRHLAMQLATTYRKTLHLIAEAIELRDPITAGHSQRVALNARAIGAELGLNRTELDQLYWAGLLHDVGKIAVPDSILQKDSSLTSEEWKLIQDHPRLGQALIGETSLHFAPIALAVGAHHEWWNGQGYPAGLAGFDIPSSGRVLAVADVFDALTSDRPYRGALTPQEAFDHIHARVGTQFDPSVVAAFQRQIVGGNLVIAPSNGNPTIAEANTPEREIETDLRLMTGKGLSAPVVLR